MKNRILTRALWLALALGGLTVGANAQDKTASANAQDKTASANAQDKALGANAQDKALGANAQDKALGANARGGRESKLVDTQDSTPPMPPAEGAKANSDVLAGIDPAAIWDGRKLMPFHALDYPKMVSADLADFLSDGDYVLGITINGQSRAYPTRYVWWHHFINDKTDQAGSESPDFLISYCSVCNTGIRFDPRVNGKPLLFDFYGLYNGVVIMCDRDTQSVWLQVAGQAVKGPRRGAQMASRPLLDTTWGEWKRLHPDTLVMSPDNPYKRFYGDKPEPRGYDRFPMPMFAQTLTRHDTRLPAFDKVLGVAVPVAESGAGGGKAETIVHVPATNAAPASVPAADKTNASTGADGLTNAPMSPAAPMSRRAYPLAVVEKAGGVINDTLGGMPVAVLLQSDTQTACAVSRILDGRTLTLEARPDTHGKTAFYDKETGTRWSIEGVGLEGACAKKILTRVDNHLSQWYGWAAYFPDTDIYGRADLPASQPAPVSAPTSAPAKP